MHYGKIKYNDIANGEGIRTSLFVSGCRVGCKGCFNRETWDFNYGQVLTDEVVEQMIESLRPGYISGMTVLGGEPMEPENQEALLPIFKEVKDRFSNKTIWLYTGYLLDQDLIKGGRKYTAYTDELLSMVDVVVDGPFMSDLSEIGLQFRGSSNQRIIHM